MGMVLASPEAARDALAARLFQANVAAYEVGCVYLGERLGLYAALDRMGSATPAMLAAATRTDERYVREWLEQQAVSGTLTVAEAHPDGRKRRYGIPPGHREVLLDRDSLAYLAPLARFSVGVWSGLPRLLEAFRAGGGVPYTAFGADAREGQADVNRTMFVNLLGPTWLPSLPAVHARLRADPPARIADLGCGTGWSSLSMARAYPRVRVDGFDLDAPSIDLARTHARQAKLEERVRFSVRDAADPELAGRYDLVTIFEALHDMAQPVAALRVARSLLNDGGAILIADEKTAETFAAPGSDAERLYYGWSVLFCLPTSREQEPSAATGAVMRPETLRGYAEAAGLKAEVAPIEHDLWRFYLLRP